MSRIRRPATAPAHPEAVSPLPGNADILEEEFLGETRARFEIVGVECVFQLDEEWLNLRDGHAGR